MKKLFKRSLVLALVLILLLQAMPMAGAELLSQTPNQEGSKAFPRYIVCRTTHLFDSNGNSIATLTPGTKITYSSGYWSFGNSNKVYVYAGTNYGYVLSYYICPLPECYKVSVTQTYL